MRKGLTLTLTTLAVAFLVTSVFAKGPTIQGVPDVYITQFTALGTTDTCTNVFRYSDALVLMNYVTVGDVTASNSLYWAYALKDVDPANPFAEAPTGNPYLTGTDVHYMIGTQSAIAPASLSEASALATQSVADAASLTFRNIRLSPLSYACDGVPPFAKHPTTLSDPFVEVQEATLFVTDKATSPSTDKVSVVTLFPATGQDYLSGGGPSWTDEKTYTTTSDWSFIALRNVLANSLAAPQVDVVVSPATITQINRTNPGTAVSLGSIQANESGYWYYGQFTSPAQPFAAGRLYRMQFNLTSTATAANQLGDIRLKMNGLTGGPGLAMTELVQAPSQYPTSGGKTYNVYLWPAATGTGTPEVGLLDTGTVGGQTITVAANMVISYIDNTTLIGAVEKKNLTDFNVLDADPNIVNPTPTGDQFVYYDLAYGGCTKPTFSQVPSAPNSSAPELVNAAVVSNTTTKGFSNWETGVGFVSTDAGKLVVAKATVTSNTPVATRIPDLWLAFNGGYGGPMQGVNNNYELRRMANDPLGNGPTASDKDYYVVFDSPVATTYQFMFRSMAEDNGTNGDIRLKALVVTQYDLPLE
jgi:hypothetical protein